MAWLHTWSGLVLGWVMFVVLLFGTAAFFHQETSGWMRPELGGGAGAASQTALDKASAYLAINAPDAEQWIIVLPSERGGDPLLLSWKLKEGSGGKPREARLDPATGREIAVRDTSGGWFLYRMHYDLYYMPWWLARYLVCIAALAMLVAILSGVVTHKKIFADFFMLRFGKRQRSWLDAHNATAVLALPFHLMMTYTGLVALLFTIMPWAISANFANEEGFFDAAYPRSPTVEPSDTPAPVLPLRSLVERAQAAWHGVQPAHISIRYPGDAASVVEMYPAGGHLGSNWSELRLSGATGVVLTPVSLRQGTASVTRRVMIDLHAARFSGPVLRWLYFVSGVGGTVMVATGLVLWTVKRRAKLPNPERPYFGFRLVERLNIGVITGAPAGIAVYFLANRLLPLDMANRADWEINSLFIAWGGLFVWTLARSTKRAWVEALATCAALYTLVPAVSAATTARGLIPSLIARDWVFAGFDLTMLMIASVFAVAAWKVAIHKPETAWRKARRELAVA